MAKVRGINTVDFNEAFSKGLIDDFGNNKMPIEYTPYSRNIRIKNGVTHGRKGFHTKAEKTDGTYNRGVVSNNDTLYTVIDSDFFSVDLDTGVYTNIGNLANDVDHHFLKYWKYTIILDGTGLPFVYDGTTLSQLTTDLIEDGANPAFGDVFTGFTFVAGTGTKSNILYISRPILSTNQERCYDWEGAGSDKRTMRADIVGIRATLSKVFIFTEESIEYLSIETVSDGQFETVPIASSEEVPVNNRCIISAGEQVFFLSKDKKIKTLNYVSGVAEQVVGDLGSEGGASIDGFLYRLDDDQSEACGYFNRKEGFIKWFVKSMGSLKNDLSIIWDLNEKTFVIDDNHFFADVAFHGGEYYAGSHMNGNIVNDENRYDDDGDGIVWERWTPNISFGQALSRKMFREVGFGGQYNELADIKVEVYVDDSIAATTTITGINTLDLGIGSDPIGLYEIGEYNRLLKLINFDWKISKGKLRKKGKRIQIKFSGNNLGSVFSLDYMNIGLIALGDVTLLNKV